MEKKESRKVQDIKNPTFNNKRFKNPTNPKYKQEKTLPWWVELFFVQIGLPDKWLVKILKSKKKSSEFITNEKKSILIIFLFIAVLTYLNPVVKYSKKQLNCQEIAKNYIKENKNLININRKKLRMLSTNFCNGGDGIDELTNKKE